MRRSAKTALITTTVLAGAALALLTNANAALTPEEVAAMYSRAYDVVSVVPRADDPLVYEMTVAINEVHGVLLVDAATGEIVRERDPAANAEAAPECANSNGWLILEFRGRSQCIGLVNTDDDPPVAPDAPIPVAPGPVVGGASPPAGNGPPPNAGNGPPPNAGNGPPPIAGNGPPPNAGNGPPPNAGDGPPPERRQWTADAGNGPPPNAGNGPPPATDRRQTPAMDRRRTPATDRRRTPAMDRRRTPATDRRRTPATDRRRTPATDRRRTPATGRRPPPAMDRRQSMRHNQTAATSEPKALARSHATAHETPEMTTTIAASVPAP